MRLHMLTTQRAHVRSYFSDDILVKIMRCEVAEKAASELGALLNDQSDEVCGSVDILFPARMLLNEVAFILVLAFSTDFTGHFVFPKQARTWVFGEVITK